MLSAAFATAAVAASTPGIDWIALAAAVVSAGLSIWALVNTKRETAARRASNVPADLRETVTRLLNILRDAEQKAERILQLNEPTHHTAVDLLEEYSPRLADKRLARLVSDFAGAVVKCRLPNEPRRDVTLTHAQREKIGRAVTRGKAVSDRLDALARKTER